MGVTAALSMGNLCCSSQNCQELIGIFCPVLIQALKDHQAPLVRDVKLQHAILGALRNLAVAPEGRHILLENDILPPCLDLISGLSLTPNHASGGNETFGHFETFSRVGSLS